MFFIRKKMFTIRNTARFMLVVFHCKVPPRCFVSFQSVGELSFLASGTAVQFGPQTPTSSANDRIKQGHLIKGKLAAKGPRQSQSDPGLAVTLEPLIASGISVHLPPVDID